MYTNEYNSKIDTIVNIKTIPAGVRIQSSIIIDEITTISSAEMKRNLEDTSDITMDRIGTAAARLQAKQRIDWNVMLKRSAVSSFGSYRHTELDKLFERFFTIKSIDGLKPAETINHELDTLIATSPLKLKPTKKWHASPKVLALLMVK